MVAHAVPLSQDSGCSGAFWSARDWFVVRLRSNGCWMGHVWVEVCQRSLEFFCQKPFCGYRVELQV